LFKKFNISKSSFYYWKTNNFILKKTTISEIILMRTLNILENNMVIIPSRNRIFINFFLCGYIISKKTLNKIQKKNGFSYKKVHSRNTKQADINKKDLVDYYKNLWDKCEQNDKQLILLFQDETTFYDFDNFTEKNFSKKNSICRKEKKT
jgi:hypothetical protein